MNDARVVSAWVGFGAIAFIAVGAGILGSAPKSDDPATVALQFTADHRGRVLAAMWVLGFGFALSLIFLIGLAVLVRRASPAADLWPAIVLSMGVATFTLAMAALAFVSSAAYRVDDLSAESARSMWDLFTAMTNVSNTMTVFLSVAVGVMILASDVLPRWIGWASFVVAVVHFGATLSLARDGAFSPTGAFGQAPGFIYLAWMLATSVALVRRRTVTVAATGGRL